MQKRHGATRHAPAPRLNGWLLIGPALLILAQVVEAQSVKDGEKIVEYFQTMADGIGIEMAPYTNGQQRVVLPTLYFPESVWNLLSYEEQMALAMYLSAESQTRGDEIPQGKERRPVRRPGVLHPWYIALGTMSAGPEKAVIEPNRGKEFYFETSLDDGVSVYNPVRLGALSEQLSIRPSKPSDAAAAARLSPGEEEELEKLLESAIVVREPSTVFTAVLSPDPEYSNPDSPQFGWESPQGPPLGTFRTGYVMEARYYDWRDTTLVRLPLPVGNSKVAHIRPNDVVALGNTARQRMNVAGLPAQKTGEPFQRYRLTPNTELLDPFNKQEIILSNFKGSIQAVYETSYAGAHGRYAIAKTSAGYFLGYVRERSVLGGARFTWEQVCRERNWPFRIKKEQTKRLQEGNHLFRLADYNSGQKRIINVADFEQVMLRAVHFESLLRNGLSIVYAGMKVPTDSGFEEPPSVPNTGQPQRTGYTRHIESVPETTEVYFLTWSENTTTVELAERKQERTVETWFNGSTIVRTLLSAWKREIVKEIKTVENDADGAARFTDGQFVYEITKSNFGVSMTRYSVEANALYSR